MGGVDGCFLWDRVKAGVLAIAAAVTVAPNDITSKKWQQFDV